MQRPYCVKRDGQYWRIWNIYRRRWVNVYSEDRGMIDRACDRLNGDDL